MIRLPRAGGVVEVYHPDSLELTGWISQSPIPAVRQPLGVDLEQRLLYTLDGKGRLTVVDLDSRGVRQQLSAVEEGVVVPDGSLYAFTADRRITRIARRTPVAYRPAVPGPLRFLYGTLGDRFIGITATKPPRLVVLSADRAVFTKTIPAGHAAATFWGDLVAVAADTAVVLVATTEPFGVKSLHIEGHARDAVFSPSGHRLYVARERPDLLVFDRFTLQPLPSIPIPGPPRALRTDASGRWMLIRPEHADTAWVVDLVTGRLSASIATTWAEDLPQVAGSATLIARKGGHVVALDLAAVPLKETGRVAGGAGDYWVITGWLPKERLPQAVAAAESASVAQDSLLAQAADSAVARTEATTRLFLQVSSSQNPQWSKELAGQLKEAGYPSSVLEPTTADEGYRVVIGPYPSREEAEEIGRKLGRPYFVLTNPPIKP